MSVSFSVIKLKILRRDVWNRTTDLKWYIQTQFMCSSFVWFESLVGTNEWQKGISNSLFFTFRNQLCTLAHPPSPMPPPNPEIWGDWMSFYARINCRKWRQLWHIHFMTTSECVRVCSKQLQKIKQFFRNLCHPCAVFSWLNYRFFHFCPARAGERVGKVSWLYQSCHWNWHYFLQSGNYLTFELI